MISVNESTKIKDSEKVEQIEEPYIDIPQDGDLGTTISYMGWYMVTSKASNQYKLREEAYKTSRYSIAKPEYYAMVDKRIVIATKPNIYKLY